MRLVIENISKQYKQQFAVDNFCCEMTNGVYGLVGPNGAGKSTLMRLIANILKPTSGRILVDGDNIKMMGDKYCKILGYLPQYMGIYRDFKARQFLLYFAALKGLDSRKAQAKVDELLNLVGLNGYLDRKIGTFSGGMKKRLGIALALLNDPKIIILDEPTAGLDPKERVHFRNLISEISRDSIILLSTHIISDIEYIAKEIIMINNGKMIKQAKPQELLYEMKEKVWSYSTYESHLRKIESTYKVGNIMRIDDGISLRIISDNKPYEGVQIQTPTLEDVYLYYFGEESKE